MSILFSVLLASGGIPLGLDPSDYAYRCDVQTLLPKMQRVEGAVVAVDGDIWHFDSSFTELIGVEYAKGAVIDEVMTLDAPVIGSPNTRFSARIAASNVAKGRYGLDWTIRGPVEGVDEDALINSGLALCQFGPIGFMEEDHK